MVTYLGALHDELPLGLSHAATAVLARPPLLHHGTPLIIQIRCGAPVCVCVSSCCLFILCFVFIHLFDHSLVRSFIHSLKHFRIHSCTSSFVLFITHSLAHSLTHQPVHAGWIAILQHIPSHCDCHSQNGQSVQQPPLCDILQPVFQVDRACLLSTNECNHTSGQEHTRIALSTKVLCQTLLDCVTLEMQ